MTVERFILEALQAKVANVVALSSTPDMYVKYVNRNAAPPQVGAWLEVVYIPNNLNDEFWDTGKTYQGIFRLLYHGVQNDQGAYEQMAFCESLAAGFVKGERLIDEGGNVEVVIADHPNLLNVIENAPDFLLPISIRYRYFKKP